MKNMSRLIFTLLLCSNPIMGVASEETILNEELEIGYPREASGTGDYDIRLTLKGIFLEEPIDLLNEADLISPKLAPLLSVIQSNYAANQSGDLSNILANWSKDDKAGIQEIFSDKENLSRNTRNIRALKGALFHFGFRYKEYSILVFEHDFGVSTYRFHYTLLKEGNQHKLTNKLSDDLALNGLVELVYSFVAQEN